MPMCDVTQLILDPSLFFNSKTAIDRPEPVLGGVRLVALSISTHAQHLATNSESQGHACNTNFAENQLFSEYVHVAYQIKENETYGNIVQAKMLP